VISNTLGALIVVQVSANAGEEGGRNHGRPVYQRHAFEWDKHDRGQKRGHFFGPRFASPQVSSGWFQRPYPYHLDYYKMRYGGSYAPYFGNLYGPPQVVTAPPYYGPYYGEFGYGVPANAGQNPGYGAMPYPHSGFPNGVVYESPSEETLPSGQQLKPSDDDRPVSAP
jgi:hypothetical protein